MIWVGIDTGISGAIALVGETAGVVIHDTPTLAIRKKRVLHIPAMVSLLRAQPVGHTQVALEQAASRPGQSSVSTCTFCCGFGIWQGILATLGHGYTIVPPSTWIKTVVGSQKRDKGANIRRACQLFPGQAERIGKNHNRADAILLAYYLQQIQSGGKSCP